ncbi:uncharacterized protein [Nicotiana sylvestris]|uniref:uncharacterized protein n=1 Tax=Nicotiana sylvestris TaxID=4096 RepID=UPI00388C5C95
MLTTEYELFRMKDDESIQDMYTRFTSIINELHSLGETIPRNKLVRKILNILPSPWESKEIKRKIDSERREPKKEKNLVLKADSNDSNDEDVDMAYLTKRFQKMTLAAWGDSSGEFEDETDVGDSSMMAVEGEKNEFDSIFALMAKSDDDEDDNNKEVNFRDVQRNLKSYSPKKLMSLASVLIDAYHSLVEDRYDLVVVVIDHKKTIEKFKEERNDFLGVIADLRETIKRLGTKSKSENSGKGKEIASVEHIRLENKLKAVRTRMCAEIEKNKNLQTDLKRVKNDLEKFLKWTWSSETITAVYTNNDGNMQGIGFQREKTPYNPHSKWSVSFGNGKKGYILGVGKVGKSLTHSIENVYYVNDLKYSLLSVSQICDKGNKVEFLSKICTITDLVTGEVVLVAKRYKNIYVVDFESLQCGYLSCLKAIDDDAELWHRRLGHTSFSLLNKLIQKDLVHGLPMSKFKVQKICDACAKGKHVKSSFKSKRVVSTSKPLELLHMDLCGPMRVQSRGGKRYIFVIVDDYSRFICSLFLRTKDETFGVFVAFVKKIQSVEEDQDGEPLLVPGEVIDMTNEKADMIEPSTSITITEAEEMVVDAVQDKALYGLKQAPRAWYEMLSKFLLENGFKRGKIDNTLFLKKPERNLLIVQVYVDDIIFGATTDSLCEEFVKLMGSEFEMSMMRELNFFLGLQGYLEEMEASKVIDTRIAMATRLDMDEVGSPVNQTMYRGIIGLFSILLPVDLILSSVKNTSGMAYFLGSCIISWGTRKQNLVALSTAEAEYVAATSCCAQHLWIKQQLEDFGVLTESMPLLYDNTSALNMAKNPVKHKSTNHIDVTHHFLRDNVEKGLICMKFCSTKDQIADIFTKALSREHFERNRVKLGLLKPN